MSTGTFTLVARTLSGLEPVLAAELTALGATDIQEQTRAVSFSGNKELVYRTNLCVRTALRILAPIHSFTATTPEHIYASVRTVDWTRFLDPDTTFAIDSTVNSRHFNHANYAALKVKDAIADYFRDKTGKRPSVDVEQPDVRIHVHIYESECTLSLDSSGSSLHKRGWRADQGAAPLNEVLAAGMILLTGWDKTTPFIDPMCGSGTLLIEAGLLAGNIAPGKFRASFGFMRWKDYDEALWRSIVAETTAAEKPIPCPILGYDASEQAVAATRKNIAAARLEKGVTVSRKRFEDLIPSTDAGMLVINPPYGERIQENDLFTLYAAIGDTLKQRFISHEAWILSANMEALKRIGLRSSKKHTLFNGQLECRFQRYALYAGSRKSKWKNAV